MWTSRERAEIGRLKNAFGRDLYDLYWIEGVTDHGEPFFVALRIIDDSLVLHLARIDGLYIALDENLEKAVEGPNLVEFINACVEHVRSPREGPSAGVVPIYAYRNGIAVWATLLAEVLREELGRNDDGGASPSSAQKHNKSDRTGLEGETRRASGQSGDQVELLGADRSARFARPTPAPVTTELRSHSTDPLVSAALLRTAMAATVVELAAASVEAAEVEAIEDGTLRLTDAKALLIYDAPPPDPSQSEDAQPSRTTLSPGLQDWSRPSSDPFQGNQFGALALADLMYSEVGRFAYRTGLAEAHSSDKKAASTLPLSAEDGVDRVPHADYATPCSLDGEVGASFNIGADASTGEEAHCAPSDEAQVAETAPEPLVSEPAQVPEVSPRTPSSLTAPNSGQSSLPTVDRVLLDVLEWQPEVPEAPQEQPAGSNDAPLPEIRDTPAEELEEPAPAGALTPPNTPDLQEAQEPGDMGAVPDVDQAPLEVALYLINPATDERVAEITEGAALDIGLVDDGRYSIEVVPPGGMAVDYVTLSLNGSPARVEKAAPYALFGDLEGDFGAGSELTAGPKTLEFEIFDTSGSSTTQQLTFDVVGAESEPEPVGRLELGTSRIAQADPDSWTRIDFDEAIPDAVVVMGPLSANGSSPTTVRVRNVDETGFEVQIDEWMYLDGAHSTETVSWMAATAGVHTLADGTTIAAGSVNAYNSVRKSVDFGTAFTEDPAFFAQVASANGSQAVTIRTEDVTEAGADVFLQEEEATNHPSHSTERVDWIAVAPGLSEAWEIGTLEVGDDPIAFAYDQPEPVILAAMQTADGGDTATLRIEDHSANQTTIWVSEERSLDQETESALQDVKILVSGENAFDLY